MFKFLFFVCVPLFVTANGGLAPFITPCRPLDASCLKTSAQKAVPVLAAGVPELGLIPLDPMYVTRVKASQAGLNMDFRNTAVKGLRNCIVLDIKPQGRNMTLDLKCSVTLIGEYKLGGKLLILPIEGEGKYKIKIRDIRVKIHYENLERVVDGVKYWTMDNWKHTATVQTGVEFQFQNLFNGNKDLSDTIHQFANTNWRDIFQEVAPPIVKAIVSKIVDEVKKLFDRVPINQLSLE